jgi:hypothetical protein
VAQKENLAMIEIFIDIETIPTSRADIQARCAGDVTPPGNYKKPESIAQWWASEGDAKKAEAIARTALNGTWGEVICIGMAINDGPVEVFERTPTEATLLNAFALELDSRCRKENHGNELWHVIAKWIGHNITDFDLRFLWQRSKLLGVSFPFPLPLQRYDSHVYDTMVAWSGYKDRVSQRDLELAFGIDRVDPLPNGGADVWTAYQEGRLDDIKAHCHADIESLRKLYRRITA